MAQSEIPEHHRLMLLAYVSAGIRNRTGPTHATLYPAWASVGILCIPHYIRKGVRRTQI
ncbi:hypothetical protein [Duncaniella muricolitica]|uniref:hypothetical protein n=1 Tax=Duncaniella muricolitica TaxID=2880704 RepID=UPI00244DF9A2|nr:hypothetical protein [Duncaniella muricolitica]